MELREVDRNNPALDPFRGLKGSGYRLAADGLVLVEGMQAVRCLLASGLRLRSLLIEEQYASQLHEAICEREGECFIMPRNMMSELVGYRLHRGILAVAERPAYTPLDMMRFPAVAFDGLADAENVGAIVRSAYAFGIRSLLLDGTSCDPFIRRAVRVSMGAALLCSVSKVDSIECALREVRSRVPVIGVETAEDAVSLASFASDKAAVWLFGSELHGIRPEVLSVCSATVRIPLAPGELPSLNVAAAAAIVFGRSFEMQS